MHVREWLNNNPKIATAITLALIAVVAIWIGFGTFASSNASLPPEDWAWYSVDDGATYFAHRLERSPFTTADGKTAVRAYLYRCGNGEAFVNHLERMTSDAPSSEPESGGPPDYGSGSSSEVVRSITRGYRGIQVKKPGSGEWVPSNGPQGMKVRTPTCPNGAVADPVPAERK